MTRRAPVARLAAILVAVLIGITGCSGDDGASGFDADPGPIDPDLAAALDEGVDVDQVPAAQRDFLETCVRGGEDTLPDIAPVEARGLVAVCGCSYDAIAAHLIDQADGDDAEARERAAYDAFVDLADDLRIGTELDDTIVALVADCIRDEAGL